MAEGETSTAETAQAILRILPKTARIASGSILFNDPANTRPAVGSRSWARLSVSAFSPALLTL